MASKEELKDRILKALGRGEEIFYARPFGYYHSIMEFGIGEIFEACNELILEGKAHRKLIGDGDGVGWSKFVLGKKAC